MLQSVVGTVTEGHKVASGNSEDSPYPLGSIEMQFPYFKKLGLDLRGFFLGTLNISIEPYSFEVKEPEFTFRNVAWAKGFPREDFSFSRCVIIFNDYSYHGLIYYPHGGTKTRHFHSSSVAEVLSEYITDIHYGDRVILQYKENEILLESKT